MVQWYLKNNTKKREIYFIKMKISHVFLHQGFNAREFSLQIFLNVNKLRLVQLIKLGIF